MRFGRNNSIRFGKNCKKNQCEMSDVAARADQTDDDVFGGAREENRPARSYAGSISYPAMDTSKLFCGSVQTGGLGSWYELSKARPSKKRFVMSYAEF